MYMRLERGRGCGDMGGDVGDLGMWGGVGDMGRCVDMGEMWGIWGRCGEIWGM